MKRFCTPGLLAFSITLACLLLNFTTVANARENILIVGSSTVFPFAITVAERFGRETKFKTPVVESTGSGGGLKLFCAGVGENTPDITNASRPIKDNEYKQCTDNGVSIIEVKIGFDGIVIANSKQGPDFDLTIDQLFNALAQKVLIKGKVVANPYKKWSDVDKSLPDMKIEVLGPPPTSGTRDAFEELVMENGCESTGVASIEEKSCTAIREDGAYIEAGENDNLIVQKLESNDAALGIFGYSFLEQNAAKIKGIKMNGIAAEFENIADGSYPIARSLFFYVKKEHIGVIPGIMEYVAAFTDESAWGDNGYLADKGMVPLPEADRKEIQEAISNNKTLKK